MRHGDIDSWQIERDGITYQVDLFADDDSNADPAGQGGCYDATDIAAHERGDWLFTGVVVTPLVNGEPVQAAQDSLWAVEYGSNPGRWQDANGHDQAIGREYITDIHPVPDMLGEVRARLVELRASLGTLNLDR